MSFWQRVWAKATADVRGKPVEHVLGVWLAGVFGMAVVVLLWEAGGAVLLASFAAARLFVAVLLWAVLSEASTP